MAFVSRSRRCIPSALRTTSATGASLDRRGYGSTSFALTVDGYTDGVFTLAVEESADGTTWTDGALDEVVVVDGPDLVDATVSVLYQGAARYVRPVLEASGSPATGATIGVVGTLSTAVASPGSAITRCTLDDLEVTTDGDDLLAEVGTIAAGDIAAADVIAAFAAAYPPKTIVGSEPDGFGPVFATHRVTVDDASPFVLRITPEPSSRGSGTPTSFAAAQADIAARLLSASPSIRVDLRRSVVDYVPTGDPVVAGALVVRGS